MQTFDPIRSEAAGVVAARVPHHADNDYAPFYFMHHALNGWECAPLLDDQGKRVTTNGAIVWEILPSLRRFKLRPGVHGIRQGRTAAEGADWHNTRARRESEGWTFIAHNAIRATDVEPGIVAFGEPVPGGYLVQYDGARGTIYADAWSRPTVRGTGTGARVLWERDAVGFARFRRDLVRRGVIPAPDRASIDALIRVQESRASRRIHDVHVPAIAAAVQENADRLDALRRMADTGALSSVEATEAPASPARKPRSARPRPASPLATARAAAALADPEDGEE